MTRTSSLGLLIVFAAATGCGDDPAPDNQPDDVLPDARHDVVPDTRHDVLPDQPTFPVPDQRTPNETCLAPAPPPPPGLISVERAFTHAFPDGADLRQVVQLVPPPDGSTRWHVARQDGTVLRFSSDPSDEEVVEVLDVGDRLDLRGPEHGLVGMALHPDFAENGHAYLSYTAPGPVDSVFLSRVSRFTRGAGDGGPFDPDSEEVILDIEQTASTHSGNHLAFGPDGYLYYSVGDDLKTQKHGQDPETLQGTILRIDVDGDPYAIPPDNPFVDGGGAPEVFAYGFRNPWRFSFDAEDGTLYVGDVGQDSREEIDVVVPGGNYGWPVREGTRCFLDDPPCEGDFVDPLVEYTRGQGGSVTAGFAYHGSDLPALQGRYVFGDFVDGRIWSIPVGADDPPMRLELEAGFAIVSFAEGPDGELYALRYNARDDEGGLYRLTPREPSPSDFPERLSETGCVDPDAPTEPAPGVVPYEPRAELWSDGAGKERFLAIPDDTRIELWEDGDFEMPIGTVLIKHFRFGDRYHETRLFMRHADRWAGYSYEWNDEQTDAALLETSLTATLPNGVRWHYPSRAECTRCHTEAAGHVLGPEVAQLDFPAPHGDEPPENQLDWLHAQAFFEPEIEDTASLREGRPALPDPFGDAPLEDRVRSYLHANCSGCHRPGGTGRGDIDLRFGPSLADTNTCDEEPDARLWGHDNWGEQRIVRPGRPADSTLYLRMTQRDIFQMPPLATHVVDEDAAALVREWIEDLEDCP